MPKFAGTCSPEQLHTLQRIFDLIWMELRASRASSYSGPSDPDALRDEIGRRVLNQYVQGGADADEITTQVLRSFGIEPRGFEQSHQSMKELGARQQGRS